jgi:tRNA modification GTPase
LRDADDPLEAAGIARAQRRLATADVRVLLLDASRPADPFDEALLTAWPEAIVVAHKSDLAIAWGKPLPADALSVSSRTGAGVEALVARIVAVAVPEVPAPGIAVPVTERQSQRLRAARDALTAGDVAAARAALDELLL